MKRSNKEIKKLIREHLEGLSKLHVLNQRRELIESEIKSLVGENFDPDEFFGDEGFAAQADIEAEFGKGSVPKLGGKEDIQSFVDDLDKIARGKEARKAHQQAKGLAPKYFEESDNYPPGTKNDPNAPWNQSDGDMTIPKKSSSSLVKIASDEHDLDWLVKSSGKFYIISKAAIEENDALKKDLMIDYSEVPYDEEPDEDGMPSRDYYFDNAELTNEEIMAAAEDWIEKGRVGTPEEFANNQNFVFELTPGMAEELWSHGSDLESHPAVQRVINYSDLRKKYPSSF